ncbi:MAG: YbaB/EbfC family nucleoid-associated protein [Phycisphaerae bacterium]|nr:YbaB/EbfC family nucleoid-associated protein [Phycisphaerae bacterium]
MFDKLKAMGALAGLMKDKERIREVTTRIQDAAESLRCEGLGGGGAVRATVNGKFRVLSIDLQPALVMGMAADERTRTLAGGVVAEAVNAALALAQARMKDILSREARELGLPDLPGDLAGLIQ